MKKTKVTVVKSKSQGSRVKEAKDPKNIIKSRAEKLVTGSNRSKSRYA